MQSGIWEGLSTKGKENGIALGAGVAVGVIGSAALNILKANSDRGTNAIGADKATKSGGVDTDLLLGALALGGGLLLGGPVGMFLVGAGLGSGTQILGREGAVFAVNQQKKLQQKTSGLRLVTAPTVQSVAGYSMPGYARRVG